MFCQTQLDQFDIICLQEIFDLMNNRVDEILEQSLLKGLPYFAMSPSPSFFQNQIVNGGLLIISRYPIIEQKFYKYPIGVLDDYLSLKGLLYVKIQIDNQILHLFNTHLQATYISDDHLVQQTVQCKIFQIKYISQFISQCLIENGYSEHELVVLTGDMNVNSRNPYFPFDFVNNIYDFFFEQQQDEKYNEYKGMMQILENDGQFKVHDLVRISNGNNPITFADTKLVKGCKVASETVLTLKLEQGLEQSLDYIFHLEVQPKLNDLINKTQKGNQEQKLEIDIGSFKVEKFLVEQQKFTQLSDHYGLTGNIKLLQTVRTTKQHYQGSIVVHN